eukprot:SAG31_NODE_5358_length_2589_cov_4.981124_2_plen_66_part_00
MVGQKSVKVPGTGNIFNYLLDSIILVRITAPSEENYKKRKRLFEFNGMRAVLNLVQTFTSFYRIF